MGLSKLGTQLVVIFFDVHVPPCIQKLGDDTCIKLIHDTDLAISSHPMTFGGVEHVSLLGWLVSAMG